MIRVLDLPAGAAARGEAHGRALSDEIGRHIAAWLASLERAGVGDPLAYVRRLLAETDFRGPCEALAPDLAEEVDAIAHGAGQDAGLVFALQLIDEEWAFRAAGASAAQKCSSVAIVDPDGPTWIAQNMDLGAHTDGFQVALRLAPSEADPGGLVVSLAGVIGLMGVNAAGLGLCVNSIPQLPSARSGVPVAFMVRRLLQARGVAEAAGLVRGAPHATSQHYLLAEAGQVRALEASAQAVVDLDPDPPGRVLHTNHPLAAAHGEPVEKRANSEARLRSLRSRLSEGRPGFGAIAGALSAFDDPAHPVCRLRSGEPGLINFTTAGMIAELERDRAPRTWISAGPPSLDGFAETGVRP